MRRNRRRENLSQNYETKRLVYIAGTITILAILTYVIIYIIYSNAISKNNNKVNLSKIEDFNTDRNDISFQTSISMGKSINEVTEDKIVKNEIKNDTIIEDNNKSDKNTNVDKIAINTSKVDETKKETKKELEVENKKKDLLFIKPVEGEIIREFSKDNLVYSQTLKEWITHTGIDIKADKTTIVKASEEGIIKSIKNDPRYGITVVIEHEDGFKTIYSNLMTAEFVKEKEIVNKGQTIGTVGNTAAFEILDESHLHFEMSKYDKYVNPSEYLK